MTTPQLILGTAQLTAHYGVSRTGVRDPGEAARVLDAAERLGVRAIDTAPAYGQAEVTIGLRGWTGAIHTKLKRGVDPGPSLTASLRALQRDRVELLYIHASDEVLDPARSVVQAAAHLVGRGTDALGVSIYSEEEFQAALLESAVTVIQVPVNVFDRRFVDTPQGAVDRVDVQLIGRSVFLQGVLLAEPKSLPRAVQGLAPFVERFHVIAAAHSTTPAALALAWVRQRARVNGVIIGVQTERELEEVCNAWSADVTVDAVEEVNRLMPPEPVLVDPRTWAA